MLSRSSQQKGRNMKTKITLATLALAAVTLAMPANAEAGFHKRGWCKPDRVFGWLDRGCVCKRGVVAKRYGKRARRARTTK
jgi:hypothetical protein